MSTQAPATGPAASTQKPTLSGVRIRTRKAVKKATKFDPVQFRNEVLTLVSAHELSSDEESGDEAEKNELDAEFERVASGLEAAGQKLDYRRYGESLIEIFLTGTVLDPGGVLVSLGENPPLPCRVFGSPDGSYEDIKKRVEVFNRVIRRYKYLQKISEDVMENVIQYLNKWSPAEGKALGTAVGVFMGYGLLPFTVLRSLMKDHLVKDGTALTCLTFVLKGYLRDNTVAHLFTNLAKANGMDQKLLDFLPPNKRDITHFEEHFTKEDMSGLVEVFAKRRRNLEKERLAVDMKLLVLEEKTGEVEAFVAERIVGEGYDTAEVVHLLWDGTIGTVVRTAKTDQLESQIGKLLKTYSELFEKHCQSAKAQVALIQKVQTFCYEDAKFLKMFRGMIVSLYKLDVLSENAVLYWGEKGSVGTSGRQVFLKQMEPFIRWLREADTESDEAAEKSIEVQ